MMGSRRPTVTADSIFSAEGQLHYVGCHRAENMTANPLVLAARKRLEQVLEPRVHSPWGFDAPKPRHKISVVTEDKS